VERVVNGTFGMAQRHCAAHVLPWDAGRAQAEAQEMYELIFAMKFLPPGRGLWAMGSPLTEERGLYAALNNCAFVSTQDLASEARPSAPFAFLMDCSMLGVGVGFDTKGGVAVAGEARALRVAGAAAAVAGATFVVPDSRQGWVESVASLIDAHVLGLPRPTFDYSAIREAGAPIAGFGGFAQGAGPLKLHIIGRSLHVLRQLGLNMS